MFTLAINFVRVREYPLTCKKSRDNGTVFHDFYHVLVPKLAALQDVLEQHQNISQNMFCKLSP